MSARKLLVRGKGEGELTKSSFSDVSIAAVIQPRPETLIGADNRVRILDSETLPWRMICSLEIRGVTGSGIGTGWFAGPKTIITAGHCVFHPNLGGWAKEIKIAPGRYGAEFPFPKDTTIPRPLASQKFEALKGWTEDLNTDFDYAVIHLNQPIGNETGWFSIAVQDDATLKGLLVNVAGYPGDRDFGRYQYFASSKIDKVLPTRFFYEADTYGGQSGGPVWFQDGTDQPVVIGVHSYGVGGSFTLNSATRINADVFQVLKGWIDADNQA
ncbi:trypsin-like serine peptidase [Leptodesmis sichuanensis]|uniref:trypsin-like serine peptidase n=1 Tax=Leptodesmis sichuanensis TaxID=2906798 RepID=UPI001F48F9B0|nr:trypsin-like peptidase domain-containing protein [Leptodesmis sichuanensis]UIE38401.1 trypsin-like peptidase domain-containing protein [Leptodesmis sichuanensis A121]